MNRVCISCGCSCESTAMVCPVCVSPLPESSHIAVSTSTTPKKSQKTLWIILGSIGGACILLLIIVIVLLCFVKMSLSLIFGTMPSSTINSSDIQTIQDFQEYYYPDYDGASFLSEEFVEVSTEMPATDGLYDETSTEAFPDIEEFEDEDMTY